MRRLRFAGRTLVGASLTVATGVAVNQILNDGKLSWSFGYLALVFTVLGALVQAAPPAVTPAEAAGRRGSRREYLRRVRSSVDQMETIGLVTQAEFVLRTQQVYVDVMLQPKPVTDAVVDSGIGPTPRPPDATVGRRASLASFLIEGCVLAVLGAAGSGKTTLARHTALELTRRRWRGRRVPVLLYLRDHAEAIKADQPKGLPEIAAAVHWLEGAIPAEWLERRLARGRCVVLLDGLDEVADAQDRSRVVQWVEAQISRYPGNAFVVTSRPQGYDTNRLTRADVLQVQRFTNHQIHTFLRAWYRAIEHRARQADPQEIDRIAVRAADDLFRRISGRPTLYELAANPLLLTMIANVHRYRGSLPGSRAALYEEVCQVLLHRRQEAKNLPDTGLDGLDGDKKERVIQELALYMMRHRMRDIPIEEAQRAIRPVLERTAPTLTPEVFLTHARRSGLLLERQYGRYGFAHLTLQEYLAAALIPGHASRRQLLIDNVDQTWWRETTLLWAARADASPVVEACLAVRTVTALNLAYACAAEARELDPDLRAQLDHLLTTNPTDPAEIRLLDGVAAARALQDTHALDDEGTRICAQPVSPDLWNRYATHNSLPPLLVANLWTADIEGFLNWLNGLFTDGTSYRLPTPDEARHALGSDLFPGSTTTLYADDEGRLRLISSNPARHPHRPTEDQIIAYPDLILDHTHLLFRLLLGRSPLTFPQLIAYARPRDLSRPEDKLVQTLDLVMHLLFVLDLPLPRALDLGVDLEHARELAIDRARARALNLNRDIGLDLSRVLDLNDQIARDLERFEQGAALDGDRALNRAVERHLARALDRAEELARDLGIDLGIDLGTHIRPGGVARALSTALDRGGYANVRLDHDPGLALLAAVTLDLDLALDRARAGDRALDHDHALDLRLAHCLERDPALVRVRTHANSHGRRMNHDVDLAFARAAARSDLASLPSGALEALGAACLDMAQWATDVGMSRAEASSRRRRRTTEIPVLSVLLQGKLSSVTSWPPADEPQVALRRAARLAESLNMQGVGTAVENARRLAAPLWDWSRPVRQSDTVLAATLVITALSRGASISDELADDLRGALCALIALTPGTGPAPITRSRDKQLVLVRN